MRTFAISTGIVILVLGGDGARGQEAAARVVVERAVKAMGGVAALQQKLAVRMKVKGKIHLNLPLNRRRGDARSMVGEAWKFGERFRMTLQVSIVAVRRRRLKSMLIDITRVVNGDKSWSDSGGVISDSDKNERAEQRFLKYVDRVTSLTALLTDESFTLWSLPDRKIENRPVAAVTVWSKDHPTIRLFFDKETGLPTKFAYQTKRSGDNKDVMHETILSDYQEPDLASADEELLRAAEMEPSGPVLVAFIRKQTPNETTLQRVRTSITQLGDDAFKLREQASKDLIAIGAVAIPFLRQASKSDDREVARRAHECLRRIGARPNGSRVSAAVRLLTLRRPKGAIEALLNYLPAADTAVADEVRAALFSLARLDGKPHPVLVRALRDKDEQRRAAAAAALGEDGGVYARRPGRRVIPLPYKIPHKRVSYVDDELDSEIETSQYQFFNAFEDKVFAKP